MGNSSSSGTTTITEGPNNCGALKGTPQLTNKFGSILGTPPSYNFSASEQTIFTGQSIIGGCANSKWKFPGGACLGIWRLPDLSKFTIDSPIPNVNNLQDLLNFINQNNLTTSSYNITFKLRLNATYNGYAVLAGQSMSNTIGFNIGTVSSNTIFSNGGSSSSQPVNNIADCPGLNLQNYAGNNIKLVAYCSGSCGLCDSGMGDMKLYISATGSVDMSKVCVGNNFDIQACSEYCVYNENLQTCYNNALEYCFTKKGDGTTPILNENGQCYSFIKQYIIDPSNKNLGIIDDRLNALCNRSDLNITPANISTKEPIYQELCSCHFNPEVYTNYYNDLVKQIPALQLSNSVSTRCLFPYCNASQFKSSTMRGVGTCPTAECIMGVTINNSGNIGGSVKINQDAKCLSFIGGGASGASGPNGGGGTGGTGTNGGGGGNGGSTGSGPVNPPVTFRCTKDSDCASGQVCNTETSVCEKSGPNWLAIGLGIGGGLLLLAILIGVIVYFTRKR